MVSVPAQGANGAFLSCPGQVVVVDPVAFWKAANGKLAYFFTRRPLAQLGNVYNCQMEMDPLGMYTRCIQACPQPGISSVKGSADKGRAEGGGWAPVVHFKHFVDCVATKCLSATFFSATALMVPSEDQGHVVFTSRSSCKHRNAPWLYF